MYIYKNKILENSMLVKIHLLFQVTIYVLYSYIVSSLKKTNSFHFSKRSMRRLGVMGSVRISSFS